MTGHGDEIISAIISAIISTITAITHDLVCIWFWCLGFICHKINNAVIRFSQTPCAELKC